MTCGCTKKRKKKQKGCREGVRKQRKDEEMAWPDWEEAEWRVEAGARRGSGSARNHCRVGKSLPMDLEGESRHEQVEAKLLRRERETLNEGEEIGSPRRKVIRVESEETQDYVREGKRTELAQEEESTFVPSAVSVPLKPLFRCDKQCSEKTLTNLCQKCFNNRLQAKGEPLTNVVKWR